MVVLLHGAWYTGTIREVKETQNASNTRIEPSIESFSMNSKRHEETRVKRNKRFDKKCTYGNTIKALLCPQKPSTIEAFNASPPLLQILLSGYHKALATAKERRKTN